MKRVVFVFILSCISLMVNAQTLKGKIVDQVSREPIAYTNIGVEGTFFGVASDAEGLFELKILEEHKSLNLYFSAVGYKNKIVPVSSLLSNEFILVELEEQTYGIGDIDVAAQSKVLFRIMRTTSAKIAENYMAGPFSMKIYYTEKQTGKNREALVTLYDEKGYRKPSVHDAFRSRNYRFAEVKRDFEPYSFRQGSTAFDELLEADAARLSNTVLNPALINDYNLHLEKSTVYNGDSVWVISYTTNKTDLAHTGDYYARKFNGKMYISKNDYGIIRHEVLVTSTQQNPQGRSLAVKSNALHDISYSLVSGYKKTAGKYTLAFIQGEKQFSENNQKQSLSQKLTVLDVITKNPQKISGRDYFEETKYNDSFWNSFIRPEN